MWLCSGLDFTVAEIRDKVVTGLWSRESAQHILGRDYLSTDAILQDLLKIEAINGGSTRTYYRAT